VKITDIRLRLPQTRENTTRLRGIASVTFDGMLVVHDIKIIAGEDRLFLAMPSHKLAEGGYRDIAHPIDAAFRAELETAVLEKYREAISEAEAE